MMPNPPKRKISRSQKRARSSPRPTPGVPIPDLSWPKHEHLVPRLKALHEALMAGFDGGKLMSNSSKGLERELFVRSFLGQVFAPHIRFGTGDITDSYEKRSGQLDIVVPFPDHAMSFPMHPEGPRLYLAEGVAAVIEVKSNLRGQWRQVRRTADKVKELRRRFRRQSLSTLMEKLRKNDEGGKMSPLLKSWQDQHDAIPVDEVPEKIPFLAVGFHGWKDPDDIKKAITGTSIDAVLVLKPLLFESVLPYPLGGTVPDIFSLMGLVAVIETLLAQKATRDFAPYTYQFMTGLDR